MPVHDHTAQSCTRQRAKRYNAAAHQHQLATPCVRDTPVCAELLWLVVLIGPCGLLFLVRHPPIFAAAVCDRRTLTLDRNVSTVWIESQYSNGIFISDVLGFLPPHSARHKYTAIIDTSRKRTAKTLSAPPNSTSSGQKHRARSVYDRGWLLYWRLRSVICHHLFLLLCCGCAEPPVCRAPLITKVLIFGIMVKRVVT